MPWTPKQQLSGRRDAGKPKPDLKKCRDPVVAEQMIVLTSAVLEQGRLLGLVADRLAPGPPRSRTPHNVLLKIVMQAMDRAPLVFTSGTDADVIALAEAIVDTLYQNGCIA